MSKSKLSQFKLHYERTGTEFEITKKVDNLLTRLVNKVRGLYVRFTN